MSKETKIGLFLIVVLTAAFAFVVYKKLDKNNEILAGVKESADDGSPGEQEEPAPDDFESPGVARTQSDSFADPGRETWQGGNDRTQIRRKSANAGESEFNVPQFEPVAAGDSTGNEFQPRSDNPWAQAENSRRQTGDQRSNARHPLQQSTPQQTAEARDEAWDPFSADADANASAARPAVHQQAEPEFGRQEESQQTFDSNHSPFQPSQQAATQTPSQAAKQAPQQNAFNPRPQQEFGRNAHQADDAFGAAEPFEADQSAGTPQSPGGNQNFSGGQSFGAEQTIQPKGPRQQRSVTAQNNGEGTFGESGSEARPFEQSKSAANDRPFQPRQGEFRPVQAGHAQASSTTIVGKGDPRTSGSQSSFSDPNQQPFAEQTSPAGSRGDPQFTSRPVNQPDPFGLRPTFREDPAALADPNVRIHVVQQSENYWTISQKQYGTARYFMALARYNQARIPDPTKMRPGMKVLIPQPQSLVARYPDLFPRSQSGGVVQAGQLQAPGFFVDANGMPMYRVGGEDTLTEIAKAHLGRSSRWIQIHEMNRDRLRNPHDLKIGTVLRLPADASQIRLVQHASSDR